MNIFKKTILAMLPFCAFAAGCTTDYDDDGFRSGAIEIQLGEITSDEIYPSAGDEIDWKLVFLPAPGDMVVNSWWDDPTGVFNVEIGIYDRFGIPIKVDRRDTASSTLEVRSFVPEPGLHYVKVKAESGRSIYSMNIKFETNYDGFEAPSTAPSFEAYIDFESETAAPKGGASAGAGMAGGADGAAAAAPAAPAGAVALPAAAAGGVVLPSAVAGGISSSSGDSGPTIVRGSTVGQAYQSDGPVKTINNSTSAVANEKTAIKPICADIKGKHKKVEAEALSITPQKKGTQIKLNVGHKDGIQDGAVGDIYVDGSILEGGRFRVDKILDKSCIVMTNAPSSEVKKATRFVVKSPE